MDFGLFDTLNLLGSLGLFLVGMKIMSDGLMELAGSRMRRIMAGLTSNRFKGMTTGLFITGLIQSSSSTTLMVVSFVNAGLLKLTEALSVIMGANIGTTLTAWLITVLGFKVSMSDIALPLMIVGFLMSVRKDPQLKNFGNFIIGFSLLFIGLDFMKGAVPDLQSSPEVFEFIQTITGFGSWSLLLFLLIGSILTLVLQSSSATMAITLIAVSQGWLPFEAACAIVLGENVGTTITANMAALVANTNARRAALSHLVFNIIGVIWVLILFTPFISLVSNIVINITGSDTVDPTVGLAVFHTTFNIINTLLLIGFIGPIAALVTRLIKDKPEPVPETDQPLFLDKRHLKYPQTAIHALLQETRHLYQEPMNEVVMHGINLHRHELEGAQSVEALVKGSRAIISMDFDHFAELHVRPIYNAIIEYGIEAHRVLALEEEEEEQLNRISFAARDALQIIDRIAQLNAELNKHMNDENEATRNAFDKIRISIVELEEKLKALNLQEEPKTLQKQLNGIKRWAKKRERGIGQQMARAHLSEDTRLGANASLYATGMLFRSICRDLLRAARHLNIAAACLNDGELELDEPAN